MGTLIEFTNVHQTMCTHLKTHCIMGLPGSLATKLVPQSAVYRIISLLFVFEYYTQCLHMLKDPNGPEKGER